AYLPRSTVFPYTTLFRSRWPAPSSPRLRGGCRQSRLSHILLQPDSASDGTVPLLVVGGVDQSAELLADYRAAEVLVAFDAEDPRSEEHTSELQSRANLVC